jgi:citrate lyase beta subunit
VQLLVFTASPTLARDLVDAGADGVILDWERRGKARRQDGHDTQINADTPLDLSAVRAATDGRLLTRVNAYGPWTSAEVQQAVDRGADEVLLPMVRTPEEVDRFLDVVDGRVGAGILIETQCAVRRVAELVDRPLSRVYLGLNDLRIDRGSTELFEPLVDGTAAEVRAHVRTDFGVAGLTVPGGGFPVPTRLLAAELVRLDARFTFLRRSFLADTAGADLTTAVAGIRAQLADLASRGPDEVAADHAELCGVVGTRELLPA